MWMPRARKNVDYGSGSGWMWIFETNSAQTHPPPHTLWEAAWEALAASGLIQIPTRPCLPLGKACNKQVILSGGEHLFYSFFIHSTSVYWISIVCQVL